MKPTIEKMNSKTDMQILSEALSYADCIVFLAEKELLEPKGRSSPVICLMTAYKTLTRQMADNHNTLASLQQEKIRLSNRTENALLMVETHTQEGTEWLADISKLFKAIMVDIRNMQSTISNNVVPLF